jgi:hypothetical protein
MLGSSIGGLVVSVHDPLEKLDDVMVVSVCMATLPAAIYCLSSLWYLGVMEPPPRASLIFSSRSENRQQGSCGSNADLFLTFISVCRPERCFLEITEFSHPVQVYVERFDSQSTPDQMKYLPCSMLARHDGQLSRSQATTHDHDVHIFLLVQLRCY